MMRELYNSRYRVAITEYDEIAENLAARNDLVELIDYGYHEIWECCSGYIERSLNILRKMGFPFSKYPAIESYWSALYHGYSEYIHCPLKLEYIRDEEYESSQIYCLIDELNNHTFQVIYTMMQKYPEIYDHIYDYQKHRASEHLYFNIAKYKQLIIPKKLYDVKFIFDK